MERIAPDRRTSLRPGSIVVFYVIWTFFLLIPMFFIVRAAEVPLGWRLLAGAATVAFGIVYVLQGVALERTDRETLAITGETVRSALGPTALLAAIAALVVPALGDGVLSFAPYLASIGVFRLDMLRGLAWSAAIVAVMLGVALLTGTPIGSGPVMGPLIAIVFLLLVRLTLGQAELEHRRQQEVAAVREREAISRDVHDLLGHSLTVVVLKAQLAKRLLRLDPDRAEHELDELLAISQHALDDVRETVGRLRVPDLASQLATARDALEDAGLEVRVEGGWDDYPPERRALAAWAVREATTNILRHAGAGSCVIRFRSGAFSIVDDGVGIGEQEGHGLTGLRSRVEESGARLEVGPAHPDRPRPGTVMEVTFA